MLLQEFAELDKKIKGTLKNLEQEIPRSEISHCFHNLTHLSQQCIDFGPASDTWAFPLESFLGVLKRQSFNKRYTTATICNMFMRKSFLALIASVYRTAAKESNETTQNNNVSTQSMSRRRPLTSSQQVSLRAYMQRAWKNTFAALRRKRDVSIDEDIWVEGKGQAINLEEITGREKIVVLYPDTVAGLTTGLSIQNIDSFDLPIGGRMMKFRTDIKAKKMTRDNAWLMTNKGEVCLIKSIQKISVREYNNQDNVNYSAFNFGSCVGRRA